MDISTRSAGPDDVSELSEFAATAIAELTPHRGGAVWSQLDARTPPYEPRFRTEIDDPNYYVAVGLIDEISVGYAVVGPTPLHNGRVIGRVTDIYVLDEARGVGVGEELMNRIVTEAAARGWQGVDSLALPGDRATKNFFETFGLVARSISVYRSIAQ